MKYTKTKIDRLFDGKGKRRESPYIAGQRLKVGECRVCKESVMASAGQLLQRDQYGVAPHTACRKLKMKWQ